MAQLNYFTGQMMPEGGNPLDKGYYATPTALTTALPTGEAGWFVVIGTTDTVWTWDADTSAWIDTKTRGLQLGETSSTAYPGDKGKTAYDHSQASHAPANAQKNSDITKGEIEAKLTGEITSHSHGSGSQSVLAASGDPLTAVVDGSVADSFIFTPSAATIITASNIPIGKSVVLDIVKGADYISWDASLIWGRMISNYGPGSQTTVGSGYIPPFFLGEISNNRNNGIFQSPPQLEYYGVDRIRISAYSYDGSTLYYASPESKFVVPNQNDSYTKMIVNMETFPIQDSSSNAFVLSSTEYYPQNVDYRSLTVKKFGRYGLDGTAGGYLRAYGNLNDLSKIALGSGAFTIEIWVKTASDDGGIWSMRGPIDGMWFGSGNGGTGVAGQVRIYTNAYHDYTPDSNTKLINDNQWHHIAWTRHNGSGTMTSYLWVDGYLQTSWEDSLTYGNPWEIDIGHYYNYNQTTNGYCDGFAVDVGIARYTADFHLNLPTKPRQ